MALRPLGPNVAALGAALPSTAVEDASRPSRAPSAPTDRDTRPSDLIAPPGGLGPTVAAPRLTAGPAPSTQVLRQSFERAVDAFACATHDVPAQPLAIYDGQRSIAEGVPQAVVEADRHILEAAEALLGAAGVGHRLDPRRGVIVIAPDAATPLGRMARTFDAVGVESLFSPLMLWRQNSKAHHDAANRSFFCAVDEIRTLAPRSSSAHELVHARFNQQIRDLRHNPVWNAWLTPIAGRTLFAPGDNYTRGFSAEELVATASDVVYECGGREHLETLATSDILRDAELRLAARHLVDTVRLHEADGPDLRMKRHQLPDAVARICGRLAEAAPTLGSGTWSWRASSYYTQLARDPASGETQWQPREVLWLALPGAPTQHVEVTRHSLPNEAVDVLFVDDALGARLELFDLDAADFAAVDGAIEPLRTATGALAASATASLGPTLQPLLERTLAHYQKLGDRARTFADAHLAARAEASKLGALLDALGAASSAPGLALPPSEHDALVRESAALARALLTLDDAVRGATAETGTQAR